jgi:hypothetical protein
LFSVLFILCFCIAFCVLFLLLYIAVCFLYLYKPTDRCHWVDTQLQSINIICTGTRDGDWSATVAGRAQLKCDGTLAETRFLLSPKGTSPFKSTVASVQSTTGSRGVRISGSNAGYTMFRGSVKSTGYPLHSPVSPSFLLLCVTVCHHISAVVYGPLGRIVVRIFTSRIAESECSKNLPSWVRGDAWFWSHVCFSLDKELEE